MVAFQGQDHPLHQEWLSSYYKFHWWDYSITKITDKILVLCMVLQLILTLAIKVTLVFSLEIACIWVVISAEAIMKGEQAVNGLFMQEWQQVYTLNIITSFHIVQLSIVSHISMGLHHFWWNSVPFLHKLQTWQIRQVLKHVNKVQELVWAFAHTHRWCCVKEVYIPSYQHGSWC